MNFEHGFFRHYGGKTAILLSLCGALAAQAQPQIVKQPAPQLDLDLRVKAGFFVEATGDGTLQYQWRLNGVNIPGATSPGYDIESVALTDGGSYSVAVSDDKDNTVESTAALLTLNLPPVDKNDFFQSRALLSGLTGAVRSNNKDATLESGEPKHAGKTGGKSIWFTWTAPANGIATFRTVGSSFDTLMGIYTGRAIDQLTPAPAAINDDDRGGFLTSVVTFQVTADQQYQIAVDGLYGASGEVVLSWDFDITGDLLPIISKSPLSKTLGPGDPLDLTVEVGQSDSVEWYFDNRPTGVKNTRFLRDRVDEGDVGRYTLRAESQNREVPRPIFSDAADIQINMTDDKPDTNAASIDKFFIAADLGKQRGLAGLTSGSKAPPRSSFGTSRGYTITQIFSTSGSTKEPGEPNHCGVAGGASEWFVYETPASGWLQINTDGSTYNTVLAVYSGPGLDFESLVPVACNNASGNGGDRVLFSTAAATTYFIAVDGVGGASGTVHLNVNLGDPPAITVPPQNKTNFVGSNVTFTVTATGTSNLFFQWKFNGVNIAGATSTSYTRTNIQPSHAGSYSVVVTNTWGSVTSSSATLFIPPSITAQPTNQTVNAGANTSFSVTATGAATLRYQWRKNGSPISNATSSALNLTNVQSTDAGTYSVVVTNTAGTVTSSNATLTVNTAPLITGQSGSKTVTAGTNPSLLVTATGTPSPNYQWQFNNANIAGATSATLTLTNFQASNEGNYRVIVSNLVGTATSSTAVLVLNSPVRVGTFSLTNGNFSLQFIGEANTNYIFQASTNLIDWTSLQTNSSSSGFLDLVDSNAGLFGRRFYRLVKQ